VGVKKFLFCRKFKHRQNFVRAEENGKYSGKLLAVEPSVSFESRSLLLMNLCRPISLSNLGNISRNSIKDYALMVDISFDSLLSRATQATA
jgi:hypothetical protein